MKPDPDQVVNLYNVNNESLKSILNNHFNSAPIARTRHDTSNAPANVPLANNPPVNIEFDDDSSDDCEMIGLFVPRPLESTPEGLIKKEEDDISNDKPFMTTVSCI